MTHIDIIILGCGNIGSVVAEDLSESLLSAQIVLADIDKHRAKEVASKIGGRGISWAKIDASDYCGLVNTLKEFDLAVGALPGETGYQVCKASVEAKVDLVDVSYMPQDVMTLNEEASRAGITLLPDCGMSPGLGNVLIGHAACMLDQAESIHLLNGGLPEKPVPPLDYVITWSVNDLIDMYSRKVSIVKKGKTIQVEAMSGLEEIRFPGVGKLEAFYTDGLRTLLYTMKHAKDMWEKTLRYPGHIEKIRLLKTLGFFDEKPVKVEDCDVCPREITAKLLERKLKRKDIPDIVAMRVEVMGVKNDKHVEYSYHMLERYDEDRQVTAMARTTAYTTSVIAQLLAGGDIKQKGVIPPEKLGMDKKTYNKFMDMMKTRGIAVKEDRKDV